MDNWSFGMSFIGRIKARFSCLYFIACNCMTVGFCCMISRAASDAVKFLKSGESSIVAPSLAIVRRVNCAVFQTYWITILKQRKKHPDSPQAHRRTASTMMKHSHNLPNTNLSAQYSLSQLQINGSLRALMSKMPSLKHQLIDLYS